MKKRTVIALGGNAIKNKGEEGTFEEQITNVEETMKSIVELHLSGEYEIVISHGNGPQVGSLLIQNDKAKDEVPVMPMFVCGAMTQGQIGYFIQQSLLNLASEKGERLDTATVVTQVEVNDEDEAFKNPKKPVGPFYSKEEAEKIMSETDFIIKEDAGRGYRRVVPSPDPLNVLEAEEVKAMVEKGTIVVAGGGGGIPVVKKGKRYEGVDAVIDKDRASALMAELLDANMLIILTAVEKVALNFGKEDEKWLDNMNVEEAEEYMKEGHFAEGSMKPKIEAVINFVKSDPDKKALITHFKTLREALNGKNGTWITS